jgi:hypothetical protein
MAFDCPRCWNTGVYFSLEFRRYLRCHVCVTNFYDYREAPEIAASLELDKVPFNSLWGSDSSVADLQDRKNVVSQDCFAKAIQQREEAMHVSS